MEGMAHSVDCIHLRHCAKEVYKELDLGLSSLNQRAVQGTGRWSVTTDRARLGSGFNLKNRRLSASRFIDPEM
jgi:hypothetical protein